MSISYVAPTIVSGVVLTTVTNAATFINSIRELERTIAVGFIHPIRQKGKPWFNEGIISTLN